MKQAEFFAKAAYEYDVEAANERYTADELETQIKDAKSELDDATIFHVSTCMEPDELKRWSSSSTSAPVRRSIELAVLQRAPLPAEVVALDESIKSMQVDLAMAMKRYRVARAGVDLNTALTWANIDSAGKVPGESPKMGKPTIAVIG